VVPCALPLHIVWLAICFFTRCGYPADTILVMLQAVASAGGRSSATRFESSLALSRFLSSRRPPCAGCVHVATFRLLSRLPLLWDLAGLESLVCCTNSMYSLRRTRLSIRVALLLRCIPPVERRSWPSPATPAFWQQMGWQHCGKRPRVGHACWRWAL